MSGGSGVVRYLTLVLIVVVAMVAGVAVASPNISMDLPEGYVEDLVYRPAPAGPLVVSEQGAVYMAHSAENGGTRVSRLDSSTGALTTVVDLAPWIDVGRMVGGPGESFFLVVDGALLRVEPDGTTSTWSAGPLAGMPFRYSAGGRMIGISHDETAVVELHPDGSATTLLGGRSLVYDVVVTADGTIYAADFLAEELIELSMDGSYRVVTAIAPDNTNLALDPVGDLYLNNAQVGFNRVDRTTGALTPVVAPAAPCRVIPSPGEVVFESNERVLFFSWVDGAVTWVDPMSGEGGRVFEPTWANTTAADVGPDGALYVGVSGCGTATDARVVRVNVEGSASIRAVGPVGTVSGLAVTPGGAVFVAASTETAGGLYYAPVGTSTLTLVPGSEGDVGSLAAIPSSDEILAYLGTNPSGSSSVIISRFSSSGLVSLHTVALTDAIMEFALDVAPDGSVYAQASEAANFFSGPIVKRWLLELDLDAGTSQLVFQHDRQGCCPFDSFAVDYEGDLWWVLNPDFLIYRVGTFGVAQLFATNTPVDAGYVNRNATGDIFLNGPEGLFRLWQPTLAERIGLVGEYIESLVRYGALSEGQGRALTAKLTAAAEAAEQGKTIQTEKQIEAFLGNLNAFVRVGILTERQADYVVIPTNNLVLPHL